MVQTPSTVYEPTSEHAGYFEVSGAHLYTVLHAVPDPVGRVLLVGPFASEQRLSSYLPWVRWARYLAARKIEVLRYDYRGVGESTGTFEEMTIGCWMDDLHQLASWLTGRTPGVPCILHGLEFGALLAAHAFTDGLGAGLLLWSPPASANQLLRSTLLRWASLQQMLKPAEERLPGSHFLRLLEEQGFLEVEGFQWSVELWRESLEVELPATIASSAALPASGNRPVSVVKLGKNATPLVNGGIVGYEEAKEFDWLFAPNHKWIASAMASTYGVAA